MELLHYISYQLFIYGFLVFIGYNLFLIGYYHCVMGGLNMNPFNSILWQRKRKIIKYYLELPDLDKKKRNDLNKYILFDNIEFLIAGILVLNFTYLIYKSV